MPDIDLETAARAEAERLVREALDHIQRAQAELDRACAALSNLEHGAGVWKAIGALYDRVDAAWYRVDEFRKKGRYRVDSMVRERLARELAAGGKEAPRG